MSATHQGQTTPQLLEIGWRLASTPGRRQGEYSGVGRIPRRRTVVCGKLGDGGVMDSSAVLTVAVGGKRMVRFYPRATKLSVIRWR